MVSSIEIGRVLDGATKFDWFERIRIIEGNKISHKVGPFGLEPEVEQKVTSVKGSTSIHETREGGISSGVGTQIKSQMG